MVRLDNPHEMALPMHRKLSFPCRCSGVLMSLSVFKNGTGLQLQVDNVPIVPRVTAAPAHRSVLFSIPLSKAHFSSDTSGVARVFGGEEATPAMATVMFMNTGNGWGDKFFLIHTRLASIMADFSGQNFLVVSSRVFTPSATLFEVGPKFRAAHSGTIIDETGRMAALLSNERMCKYDWRGRRTRPFRISCSIHHSRTVLRLCVYPSQLRHIRSVPSG
ncbi:hypothetical protein EDC04DRAFT_1506623 [Pisolithus marmoratus]|nr:hypothetical protein EDC04DRAFT_1506623 [Pisolithus marmoratus]